MLPEAVFTVNRKFPSWVISTQHGAVWLSANGDAPIELSVPSAATLNAETVPLPGPSWALDTNSWPGLVGRNSLPNGPGLWAGNGEPVAAVRRPSGPTEKLSISELPTRVPTRFVPVELNRTPPGFAPSGRETVEPASGSSWPSADRTKPA